MRDSRPFGLIFGDSQMASLIREYDWSATGIGAIADWPEALRCIVSMTLRSPLPIVTLWGEPGIMIYNDAYSVFAGARHPQLLGSEVRQGWPEVAEFNDNIIRTVFRKGETLSYKDTALTLDRGDGAQQVWLDLDYSPVVGDDGTPLGVIAIVVETTAKIVADRQLRDERIRLRQMYEQSPSFNALLEGPEHRFTLVNQAYRQVIGHRDVLGRTVAESLSDAVDQGYLALLDEVFASGRPHRSQGARYDVQARPGGEVQRRYLDFIYQPITDSEGQVTGIFVDGVDVTDRVAAQETIRASEQQFRTFAQAMPNHAWTAGPDGALDWFNDRVGDYSGRSTAELAGAGWAEIVHPEDRAQAGADWAAAIAGGHVYETEFRIRRADGRYRWHLIRALPVRDEAGTVIRWVGTNTDVHEQKLAEAASALDRDRLWNLSQDLMLVCDFKGVVTAVNPSATRLLGWEEEEMVGRSLTDFLHPEDIADTAAELGKLSFGATALAFENRYLCKDGSYRLLDWSAVPDAGRIHAVGRDITEERRLTRDWERIWNLSPVLKVVVSLSGAISAANPSWSNVLGWTEAETVGRDIMGFIEPEDRTQAAVLLGHLRDEVGIVTTETPMLTKDGLRRVIAWTAVRDSGRIYGFGRDITAETEAAAALARSEAALRQAQKMEAIGQLTGGVAHDFNNLLQVVGGNLQLLSKDIAGNARAARRVQNAMEGVDRGSRLAAQLLAFGRRQPLAPKVVHLGRLLRGMDTMLRHALGEAVEIETIVAGGLWNTLVDPGNVENALLNLAINARDAMEGQGKLTIETGNAFLDDYYSREHHDVTPGQYVLLAVTDTGKGIPPELLDKVFDPFFSTKAEGKGTGLGLSMVYGFVKQSGGHVKIYSEPGEGTTINLYLPRSTQAEDEIVFREGGPITGGTETILVAEDDRGVRETVIETLTDLGYTVLKAGDAQSAMAIIDSGAAIDLLFTDVVMPGPMKATELAQKAVERLPGLSVLFTSGYTENSIVHAGRLDAGVELLSKPYTREALARKIRHQLRNAAQRREAAAGVGVGEAGAAGVSAAGADKAGAETAGMSGATAGKAVKAAEVEAEGEAVLEAARVPGAVAAEAVAPGPADALPEAGTGLRILVCEDDLLIRMATVDMLTDFGHSAAEAGTAAEALAILAAGETDLLVTDVGLPDMQGTALAREARALFPALPVIYATGHSEVDGVRPDATTEILVKPFGAAGMTAAIEALFPGRGGDGWGEG